jgi:carboxylate-amine ligase
VPDAQSAPADAAAIAAFAHALVARLAERHAAGEPLGAPEDWRIAENRWAAARHGVDAHFADLVTGERRPARDVLHARLDELAPVAERLGCAAELTRAHALVETNAALRARAIAAAEGPRGLARRLAECY